MSPRKRTAGACADPAKASAMSMFATPKVVIFFEPVPGGFVYAAPKPWLLLGRSNQYFVTEAQKSEITAASQPPTFMAMFCTLMTTIILGVGTAVTFNWYRHSYQLNDLTWSDISIMLVAIVLSMLLAFKIAFRSQINRLRPLLATIPKSHVRITRADVQDVLMNMNTAKQLWLQVALSALLATLNAWFVFFPTNMAEMS